MPYTDTEFFLTKMNESDLNNLINSSNSVLDSAVESADSLINSYLKNVVTELPLNSPPASIKQCSYDIALFYLHDRIQYSEIPQWVKDKYNAAIDFLTKIAKGVISLDVESSVTSEDNIKYFGSETVMNRDSF
jgi:phage gp36-like protein